MEKCPDKETLEKFIDYGLTEEMNEKILAHLLICESCRDKVGCILYEDQSLLKSLASETTHSKDQIANKATGKCISKATLLAYVSKSLKEDQLKLVESHLQICDNCMFQLFELQRAMNTPAEIDFDMSAVKTRPVFGFHALEIVLKAKDNVLELIKHTGELLSVKPQLGAVRGSAAEEYSIVIRKVFQDRDMSLEVKIDKKIEESGTTIGISIMRLSDEEFPSGMDIELMGREMTQARTSEDGFAEFSGIKSGRYDLIIRGDVISHIDFQ